jgi:tetratricopeptide repeat protein 21B
MGRTTEMAFLEVKIASRKECSEDEQQQKIKKSITLIDEALKKHIQFTKSLPPGFDFYINLNPDFLLELAKEYLQFADVNFEETDVQDSSKTPIYVKNGNKLLRTVLKQIPGLTAGYLLLAKGKLIQGDIEAA